MLLTARDVPRSGALTLGLLVVGALAACGGAESVPPAPGPGAADRVVAHGGGAVDGAVGTNSLEALEESAARGFRLIEVDLSWTSDDRLVLLHDWGDAAAHLERSGERAAASRDAFLASPLPGGRTPLDLDAALDWLAGRSDVSLVTDVKTRNVEALTLVASLRPDLLARVVPQVHDPDEAAAVRALGFDRIVLTLYASRLEDDAVVRFAAAERPFAVTLPWPRAMAGDLPARLGALGVRTFAHTVNDFLRAGALRARGVTGVYTDLLHPDEEERARRIARLAPWRVERTGARELGRTVDPWVPTAATVPAAHPRLRLRSAGAAADVRIAMGGATESVRVPPRAVTDVDLRARDPAPEGAASVLAVDAAPDVTCAVVWDVVGRGEWVRTAVTSTQERYEAHGAVDGLGVVVAEIAAVERPTAARIRFETADGPRERRVEVVPGVGTSVPFPLPAGATGPGRLVVEGDGLVVRSHGAPATLAALIEHR